MTVSTRICILHPDVLDNLDVTDEMETDTEEEEEEVLGVFL